MRHRAAKSLEDKALADTLSRVPTAERRERWEQMAKGGYSEAELADAVRKMEECLDNLQAQLSETPWLVGHEFSLADIAVLPFADRIRNLRPDLLEGEERTAIAAWLGRARLRPSFDRAIDFTEDPRAGDLPNI
jgi:glutathione S-transferase